MVPILYLSHCGSTIGGGEKQLAYLVTNIDRTRYEPFVVCPDDGVFVDSLRGADIPTAVLALPPWRKTKSLFTRYSAAEKLIALAEKQRSALVHTSDSWFNPYLCSLSDRLKIPVISHVRNLLTPQQVQKYRFNRMDRIIAISEQSSAPLIQAGVGRERLHVIPNCVDTAAFQPSTARSDRDAYVVGIVGRIEPFKRQKTFVEMAAQVAKTCPNIRFRIIGGVLDTPEHRAYERTVRTAIGAHRLQNRVCFTGHRTDMPQAMQELDLLVTLSAGSVIAEAMAAGKPVIGTPIGSSAEMIVHGVTGYILPADPITEIADRVVELARDRTQSRTLGARGRQRAESVFTIQKHTENIQAVYEQVLSTG